MMELKKFTDGSWRIYYNGKFKGYLVDFGSGYELTIQDKTYEFSKKEELKQIIERMLEWDAYEVYSEYKAKLRGFKIIG